MTFISYIVVYQSGELNSFMCLRHQPQCVLDPLSALKQQKKLKWPSNFKPTSSCPAERSRLRQNGVEICLLLTTLGRKLPLYPIHKGIDLKKKPMLCNIPQ